MIAEMKGLISIIIRHVHPKPSRVGSDRIMLLDPTLQPTRMHWSTGGILTVLSRVSLVRGAQSQSVSTLEGPMLYTLQ